MKNFSIRFHIWLRLRCRLYSQVATSQVKFMGFFFHSSIQIFHSCVASHDMCSVYSYTSAFVSYLIDNNSNKMIVMMIIISLLTFCLCWWLTTGPISSNRTTSKELTIHCCYGTFRFLNVWAIFLYENRNEKRKEKGREYKDWMLCD